MKRTPLMVRNPQFHRPDDRPWLDRKTRRIKGLALTCWLLMLVLLIVGVHADAIQARQILGMLAVTALLVGSILALWVAHEDTHEMRKRGWK